MKKLLTFLTLLTLFFGVGWAATSTVTLKYSGSITTNMTGDNDASTLGLNASDWSVIGDKGNNSNFPGLNKDGDIRLYYNANGGNTITVTSLKNYSITSIAITFTGNNHNNAGVSVNGSNVTGTGTDTEKSYSINGTSFVVRNANTSNTQVRISQIVITYDDDGGSTPEPTTYYSLTLPTSLTGGSVTATGASDLTNIAAGTRITVTATPNDGYELDWMKANDTEVTSNPYTFTINANTTITAAFKEQSTTPTPTGSNVFERITSVDQLEVGKRYLLVYETGKKAAGTTGSNKFLAAEDVDITNNQITLDANSAVVPFTLSGSTGAYKLADGNGKYITPTAAKKLTLDKNGTVTAAITFSENNVTINFGSTLGIMYYNTSSPRFLNYTSTQTAIQLYKEVESTNVDPLYLLGYGMNSKEGWNLTDAPAMTYSTNSGTYAVDVVFDKAQRGYFQFAKGLSNSDSNWDGLTGRLYPSTSGSNVSVDSYAMDGTVGLYFTDQSNTYSFELPAGLYTIAANLGEWKTYVTKKDITVTIAPNSATFNDGSTKKVTMTSNLTEVGGKIYYTTDGTVPSATNGTEYTGEITLDATTTIKAIAILNYIQSDVAEKTYIKLPAAPVITPNGGNITEPTQVTITAEEGTTIYYTLDGTDPTPETGTLYTGPFTISETTTVKARAYVGTYYSTATAQFTYTEPVVVGDGDYVKVTSSADLTDGQYLIVYEEGSYAFNGALSTLDAVSNYIDVVINDNVIPSTATVDAAAFTFNASAGTFMNKDGKYIGRTEKETGNGLTANTTALTNTVTIDDDGNAVIKSSGNTYLRFNATSGQTRFRYYQSGQKAIALYKKNESKVAKPVISPEGGVFTDEFDATITCATEGATIYYTTDGSEPTTSSAVYSSSIHVDKSMTIKAIAEKDGDLSQIAEAVYQCTMVENIAEYLALPIGTENVVFKNPVVVQYNFISDSGNSYIYVKDDSGCAYFHQPYETKNTPATEQFENGDVIGARFYGDKDYDEMVKEEVSEFAMFTNLKNFAATGSKALAEPELKTVNDVIANDAAELNNHYIIIKKVKLSDLYDAGLGYGGAKYFDIYDENGNGQAHLGYNKFNLDYASVVDDLDAYYNVTAIFTAYNNNLEVHPTEIVKWAEKEITLRDLCENGEEGESYRITNNLQGVYANGNSLWVKDENGQSILKTSQADNEKSYYIDAQGNTREEQSNYDQSNWLEVIFPSVELAKSFENTIIEGYSIYGKFDNKLNPTLTLESANEVKKYGNSDAYAPNYYCVANFLDYTGDHLSQQGNDGNNYFFMNPKPQEYATITWAMWENGMFVIPAKGTYTDDQGKNHYSNYWDFDGAFSADWSINADGDQSSALSQDNMANGMYEFHAIVRMNAASNAPRRADSVNSKDGQTASKKYTIYPVDFSLKADNSSVITGVNDVKVNGEVLSVTYYNVAGMQSSRPFGGVNIVVTRYTDGTTSTRKVVK